MSFFDTTPLGRIVNRFSKDIDTLDVNIPTYSQSMLTTLAPLISTLIIIVYSTPIFLVVLVPLAIFIVFLNVSSSEFITCSPTVFSDLFNAYKFSPLVYILYRCTACVRGLCTTNQET